MALMMYYKLLNGVGKYHHQMRVVIQRTLPNLPSELVLPIQKERPLIASVLQVTSTGR